MVMNMQVKVQMADPAGNRTAIVRSSVPKSQRARVAAAIMNNEELRAEQVGFETRPLYGGSAGRIEMMGGEFCGNAARSFGYMLCSESEKDHCKIEISGTREQLEVICDLERSTSAAQMPMPEKMEMISDDGENFYPLVISRGITHLIAVDQDPDEAFVGRIISKYGKDYSALGVQFVKGDQLTPFVYVCGTDTVVAESSCGSGSLAAAWYLSRDKEDGFHTFTFVQPGGEVIVRIAKRQGKIAGTIGGHLALEEPVTVVIEDDE